MSFFNRQIEEIERDPVLRRYGAALALINFVTALFWLTTERLDQILAPAVAPICWPFLDSCGAWRIVSQDGIAAAVYLLLILALVNAFMFCQLRHARAAYWVLLALSILKAVLRAPGFNLIDRKSALHARLRHPTVPAFIGAAQAARDPMPLLRRCSTFWAGVLKLNPEWLSGAAHSNGRRPFNLPEAFMPAACTYVVVLELIVVFGVLSSRRWIFWLCFNQLIVFHIASFWAVGFFYPCMMFPLLSILRESSGARLALRDASNAVASRPGFAAFFGGAESRTTYVFLTGFCVLQLIPRAFPGDPSVTGEGRMFALHMFDAPLECKATALVRTSGRTSRDVVLRAPFLTSRIACDPIVYFELAKDACLENDLNRRFDDLDLDLRIRKQGQVVDQTVARIESFCSTAPRYDVWRHNLSGIPIRVGW